MIALIVEDERDQRDLVCEVLEVAGWRVELAEDGIAALGRIRRVRPDVVLLDLTMPHLDGNETLRMLRSDEACRSVPVIVTTGAEVAPDVVALADLVLRKPFSPNELIQAVLSHLERGR